MIEDFFYTYHRVSSLFLVHVRELNHVGSISQESAIQESVQEEDVADLKYYSNIQINTLILATNKLNNSGCPENNMCNNNNNLIYTYNIYKVQSFAKEISEGVSVVHIHSVNEVFDESDLKKNKYCKEI